MFRNLLVPLDGSAHAEHALPLAVGIARRAGGSLRLALVHHFDYGGPEADVAARQAQREYLGRIAGKIGQLNGSPVATELLEGGAISSALCAHAQAVGTDLMVLTTHGLGPLSRFWLGSVADELLRDAPLPLLIYRPTDSTRPDPVVDRGFRRILVPLDGSEASEAALAPAAALARLYEAGLLLLRVVVPAPEPGGVSYLSLTAGESRLDEQTAQARADLDRIAAQLRADGLEVDTRVVVNASAASALIHVAPVADLIVLTTHGRGRIGRFFLGSVADKVVRGVTCPVLVVRSRPSKGELP